MVWATRLRDDPFVGPRIRFTLVAFFVIVFLLTIGNYVLTDIGLRVITRNLVSVTGPTDLATVAREMTRDLSDATLPIVFVIGFLFTILLYFLSGITLSPIQKIVRAQKRFIADASHELRTPLSIIKADSEVALLDGNSLPVSEAISTLRSNLQEVDRMSKIIQNLLAVSFYNTKITEIPFDKVDLSKLVTTIVDQAQSIADKKDIKLYTKEADPQAIIWGNHTALEQMAMNLIRNAILYTPIGGEVAVSVSMQYRNSVVFSVTDTGVGISAKDLPHILNPFYKAEHSQSKDGSGLGLTIVKKIIERHHGFIDIQSEQGKGTTVTVSFTLYN